MARVFAVHARATTRHRVAQAVSFSPGFELLGQATSADEARRVANALAPDVMTLDARLPDGDGISLAAELRRWMPKLGVVVLGPARERELVLRALDAGLSAYLPETATVTELAAAMHHSIAAAHSFSATHLAALLRRGGRPGRGGGLSQREQLVLQLTQQGMGIAAIAALLLVSDSTVRTYISRIRGKRRKADPAGFGEAPPAESGPV